MTTHPVASEPDVQAPTQVRKGARLGAWSLTTGLIAVVWFLAGFVMAILGLNGLAPFEIFYVAIAFYFFGFFVIPSSLIASIALGIPAVITNRPIGKVLAIVGMALSVVIGIVFLSFTVGSNDWINELNPPG